MDPFYEMRGAPIHSCVLMPTREKAVQFPRGDIRLAVCGFCGFITNQEFEPALLDYRQDYEETQGFSPTFQTFARGLANDLIDRFDLRDKHILEIGCGKGEFLLLLCELGGNRGTGIDPAYVPERTASDAAERITFIRDFFSDEYSHLTADFICCRHTLEHIHQPREFMELVRRTIGERRETIVFFDLPDVSRVLKERAFWDIYYEHCSYFTLGSLARLFRSTGFEVLRLSRDFDDQYLLIDAQPSDAATSQRLAAEGDLVELIADVNAFRDDHADRIRGWREMLRTLAASGRTVAVWGAGSKCVAFLTTLGIDEEVACAVDINPFKQGKYVPGTGHEIVSPESLTTFRPDVVVVMNPVYRQEIRESLDDLGIRAEVVTV